MSVAPSLPHRGDRPAPASGTSTSRENRDSFPISDRRIDVLLPNLQQRLLVRPQYESTCLTCSAWRSDGRRTPRMRTPQWRHRPPNRRLALRSPPKVPSTPADQTCRKHNRGNSMTTTALQPLLCCITDAMGC
ncbi:hypothetical protein TcCL_Unassigned04338 [Trypanosoma cruzi]|nr:hypothetical protein TcCL_Unassigned04338 [Trypanosoma cruzi]